MSKMSNNVKGQRSVEKSKRVTNWMGGNSYELNPLDTLKMITASSIFGEPQYYREGEWADKKVKDGSYSVHHLVREFSLIPDKYEGKKTSDVMEQAIDDALDYDYAATLEWARTLRKDFWMRLNPQIVMVRAATHPGRVAFTEANPGKFKEINMEVMSRLDEPASQLTYWLFKHKTKKNIPSLLKRSWASRIEKASRYQIAKYKNAGIGLIDTVRVSHASSPLVDELMKTGTIEVAEDNSTWERLSSAGKTWTEILDTIKVPHMALLRNLRNIFAEINDAGKAKEILQQLKDGVSEGKQFPYRYYTAIQVLSTAPINHKSLVMDALEECIDIAREALPKLSGKTMCLSDNSGSAWGALNSEYGSVTVAEIGNLSSILTAQNSDEGYVGIFGDRLTEIPVSKRNGALTQAKTARDKGKGVGGGTENGIWLFFEKAIKDKEHWDNIFIYSDQQAGHGGLFATPGDAGRLRKMEMAVNQHGTAYIDVVKLVNKYRAEVNPKVNVFTVQTAGYNNVLVPETMYRTSVLYGWTGKESVYADAMIKFWDEKDAQAKK
ncbi:TROVE domain protein [compost metagenome]